MGGLKMKLTIKTITGVQLEIEGNDYKHENGIHYLKGSSYPDEIVVKMEKSNE